MGLRTALLAALIASIAGCGGDDARPTIDVKVGNDGSCSPGCAERVYTFSTIMSGIATSCSLHSKTAKGPTGTVTLEGLPLSEGEELLLGVTVTCKANPGCPVCYGELEDPILAKDGATARVFYGSVLGCDSHYVPKPCQL